MANAEFDAALLAAAGRLARLRRTYERYWAGLERPEPIGEREALRLVYQGIRAMADGQTNTAANFRARSAQASFLAFDELCTRRAARELDNVAARLTQRRAAPPAPSPVASTAPPAAAAGALAALYADFVALKARQGLKAGSPEQFAAQVAAHLAAAEQRAPGQTLRPALREQPDGRVQLVVEVVAGAPAPLPR